MKFDRAAKNLSLAALLGAMALFAISCETLDSLENIDKEETTKDKAAYVFSVHEVVKYPRAQQLEINIPSFYGTPVCINANYYLHSKNVKKIELIEEKDKPGFYDIDLFLDRKGRILWTSLSVNFRYSEMAFVIDGICYRCFKPEQLDSDEDMVVRIKGPFDTATAMGLKKNSEKNYKVYNSDKEKL